MTMHHTTREAWLTDAVDALSEIVFADAGCSVPTVRVSVGWPGGRGKKHGVLGQCWTASAADDGASQVFISPTLTDPARVLDVLAHELCHAIDGNTSGHSGYFTRLIRRIGLDGPADATVAGPRFTATATALLDMLGPYPHSALNDAAMTTTQSTRMVKLVCAEGSGYLVRTSRKWIAVGMPSCPCHGSAMVEE